MERRWRSVRWLLVRRLPRSITMTLHESAQLVLVGDSPNQTTVEAREALFGDWNAASDAQRREPRLGRTKHGGSAATMLHHLSGDDLLALAFRALVHGV